MKDDLGMVLHTLSQFSIRAVVSAGGTNAGLGQETRESMTISETEGKFGTE